MKKQIRILLLSMITSFMLVSTSLASSVQEVLIDVDGVPYATPVMIQNDHQLVPASFFKNVQAKVQWDPKYHAAVIHHPNMTIGFPSGHRYADYTNQGAKHTLWERDYLNTTTIDHKIGTFIPLAYTARKLGMEIVYDSATKKTAIYTEPNGSYLHREEQTAAATHTTRSMTVDATEEDLYWLYQMTEAEAGGESYEGKVAVAASILNRLDDEYWPDTITDILFHVTHYNGKSYYQYSPVLDKRIYQVKPSDETKKAVHAALQGEDPSLGATIFYNPAKTNNQWVRDQQTTTVIGNHVFAK